MKIFLSFLFVLFISLGAVGLWIGSQIPTDQEIKGCLVTKMYQVKLCPGSREYVPLRSISSYLQKSIIMSEDAAFWTHHGFDWDELEKSALENWEKGTYKRGGSTISQQLAKNMFLTPKKSLLRKGLEAMITMRIEKVLKKTEILERYLNVVEFGKNLYGVKAASYSYFRKSPAELDLVEAAFLTMLLPSPIKYAKSYHQKAFTPFAQKRIRRIIADLSQTGRITPDEYAVAMDRMDNFFGTKAEDPEILDLPTEPGEDFSGEEERTEESATTQ